MDADSKGWRPDEKKKEELLEEINRRKANRKAEIARISLTSLRNRYMSLADNDEKLKRYFGDWADGMIKYFNNPVLRPVLHRLWRGTMPWVFKKQFGLGHGTRDFFDSVVDYYMYATSYGAWPLEIAEVNEERVVGYFDVCPGKCEKHLGLCLAITSLEPLLSQKSYFGATVTFTERIPAGDPRCKVVFERK